MPSQIIEAAKGGTDVKFGKWLENWDMTGLKIKTPFLDMEWKPQDEDKAAAWELYVELLTRITTQPLAQEHGDEKTALDMCSFFVPNNAGSNQK